MRMRILIGARFGLWKIFFRDCTKTGVCTGTVGFASSSKTHEVSSSQRSGYCVQTIIPSSLLVVSLRIHSFTHSFTHSLFVQTIHHQHQSEINQSSMPDNKDKTKITAPQWRDADYRGFLFVVHCDFGLLLLHCTRKKHKPPHWQLPGGHVDEAEFVAAGKFRQKVEME